MCSWSKIVAAPFLPGALETVYPNKTVTVARTSMYSLRFVHYDAALGVATEGKTIWKNSHGYGYLPAQMAPLLAFYGIMYSCGWRSPCCHVLVPPVHPIHTEAPISSLRV